MNKKNFSFPNIIPTVHYKEPRIVKGKNFYVEFYAFDPATGKLKRYKRMFDSIKPARYRNEVMKSYADEVSTRLRNGWNPNIDESQRKEYTPIADAFDHYRRFLEQQCKTKGLREATIVTYSSRINIFQRWLQSQNYHYVYELKKGVVVSFLDYVYIERDTSPRQYNNYHVWLKTFFRFLCDHDYKTENPVLNISKIRNTKRKQRSVIPPEVLSSISKFLLEHNPHFLLACYLTYYNCIRPKELSCIKINDIHIKSCTLSMRADDTKNKQDAILTMPKKILRHMLDLSIFDNPGDYYLFSDAFRPGREQRSSKRFRDYWHNTLSKKLSIPKNTPYYSLKDTGITEMLKNKADILTVRDQARHSSIKITDIYTPHHEDKTNDFFLNYDGSL